MSDRFMAEVVQSKIEDLQSQIEPLEEEKRVLEEKLRKLTVELTLTQRVACYIHTAMCEENCSDWDAENWVEPGDERMYYLSRAEELLNLVGNDEDHVKQVVEVFCITEDLDRSL